MARAILSVPDISCEHCERAITNALGAIAGVSAVAVDVPAKRVTVEYDDGAVGLERLTAVLAGEDYPVASVEAAPR